MSVSCPPIRVVMEVFVRTCMGHTSVAVQEDMRGNSVRSTRMTVILAHVLMEVPVLMALVVTTAAVSVVSEVTTVRTT
jgi:hypothetical protein